MADRHQSKVTEYENFYLKLREKIFRWVEDHEVPRRVHGWTGNFFQYLMLLPDMVYLVIQLLKDRLVHVRYKTMLVVAMTYLVFPLDIIPDFIPVTGFIDDLLVVVVILNRILNSGDSQLIERVRQHWAGEKDILLTLQDIIGVMNSLAAKIPRGILNFMDRTSPGPRDKG